MLNTFFVVGDHFETRMYRIATKKKLSITISVLFAQHMLWGMLWPKATAEATALGFGTRVPNLMPWLLQHTPQHMLCKKYCYSNGLFLLVAISVHTSLKTVSYTKR